MLRTTSLIAATLLALAATGAQAITKAELAEAAKAKAASKAASKVKEKLAQPAALPALSDSQLAMAERVNTGAAACEFNQTVDLQPHASHKGAFNLAYKKAKYTLVPEDTTTGAVRLEDKKNGIVWIQIANKSMLMNAKVGQRMVDNCVHEAQMAAAQAAGNAPGK